MNTLGSWIDLDSVAGIARDLAPALPSEWAGTLPGTPLTGLAAEDFRLPDNFLPAPFPTPADADRERMRTFLQGVRQKAEHSGLIHRGPGQEAPAVRPSLPALRPITGSVPVGQTAPVPAPSAEIPDEPLPVTRPPLNRTVPHFEPPAGPLATRVRALTDWIRRQMETDGIFIIDAQGCPVSDRDADQSVFAGAVLLADAARRARQHLTTAADGAISLDMANDRKLSVIDAATNCGAFSLVLLAADAPAPRAADRLRRALKRTVEFEPAPPRAPARSERW